MAAPARTVHGSPLIGGAVECAGHSLRGRDHAACVAAEGSFELFILGLAPIGGFVLGGWIGRLSGRAILWIKQDG